MMVLETFELAMALLNTVPKIIAGGKAALDSFNETKDKLVVLQQEGRDPTPQERAQIMYEIDALENRIYSQVP